MIAFLVVIITIIIIGLSIKSFLNHSASPQACQTCVLKAMVGSNLCEVHYDISKIRDYEKVKDDREIGGPTLS